MRMSFFGFTGRANRARYWLYLVIVLPSFVALFLAFYAYAMSFPGAYENGGPTPWPTDPLGIAGAILWFAALGILLLGGFSITVRRLHDRDRTGWWALIFVVLPNGLPVLGQYLIQTQPGLGEPMILFPIAAFALAAWGFVELGCLRGTAGENRYGPDPLAG
jgi:uncharacterized membrane protein YhaH (DUF805 family)